MRLAFDNVSLAGVRYTVEEHVYALIPLNRKAGRAARGVGSHSQRPTIWAPGANERRVAAYVSEEDSL